MKNLFVVSALLEALKSSANLNSQSLELLDFYSPTVSHCTLTFTNFSSEFELREQFIHQNKKHSNFVIQINPHKSVNQLSMRIPILFQLWFRLI